LIPLIQFTVSDLLFLGPNEEKVTAKPAPCSLPTQTGKPNSLIYSPEFMVYTASELVESNGVRTLNSCKEAVDLPQSDEWKKAMKEEFEALMKTGTFELVPLPKGKRTIGARWLFKLKQRADGTIDCYKARWVGKG